VAYRFKWGGGDEDQPDARGSVPELTGTVGLFYIFLICLGILFVTLKNLQGQEARASQVPPSQAAFSQALLPFDSGR
jgi:hypothetical protein